MLAAPLDAVWLPVPIALHRPFCTQALAAGKAVMCEKPAAGSVDDVDAMIQARDRAALPVAIGYQNVYETSLPLIKRRLAEGAVGVIREATVCACWPRGKAYYGRNPWAGSLHRDGVWVLDSPANNALAHFINLALFLLGPGPDQSATPLAVEAELYRANPIENYDTCSLRLTLDTGPSVLVLLTHACAAAVEPRLVIHGGRGRLDWSQETGAVFRGPGGSIREHLSRDDQTHRNMVRRFVHALRGRGGEGLASASLEVARAHTVAINGASQAARIVEVPPDHVLTLNRPDGPLHAIAGIEEIFVQCAARRQMLGESRLATWTVAPGRLDLHGYRHFAGPAS
jgi:predicted dehydrogenase